jgi:hypothetical protein
MCGVLMELLALHGVTGVYWYCCVLPELLAFWALLVLLV